MPENARQKNTLAGILAIVALIFLFLFAIKYLQFYWRFFCVKIVPSLALFYDSIISSYGVMAYGKGRNMGNRGIDPKGPYYVAYKERA